MLKIEGTYLAKQNKSKIPNSKLNKSGKIIEKTLRQKKIEKIGKLETEVTK